MAQTPKQQYYDPFGMKRSGTFGNSFFNNMGSFF